MNQTPPCSQSNSPLNQILQNSSIISFSADMDIEMIMVSPSSSTRTATHLAYSAMFLMDMDGVVQAVEVTGGGDLGMEVVWKVFDLVRDSFAVEEAEATSDLFTRYN